jgi:hypothetical protein
MVHATAYTGVVLVPSDDPFVMDAAFSRLTLTRLNQG